MGCLFVCNQPWYTIVVVLLQSNVKMDEFDLSFLLRAFVIQAL
jgi:hypothetical protein